MQAIRKIKTVNTDTILLNIPKSFMNKKIEILMFPVEKDARNKADTGRHSF